MYSLAKNSNDDRNASSVHTVKNQPILALSLLFSPVLVMADYHKDDNRELLEKLKEYQYQLETTNQRLEELEQRQAATSKKLKKASEGTETAADNTGKPESGHPLKSLYDGGFTWKTDDKRYSITINGLAQARYTLNLPNKNTGNESQGFDLALGRLFFSGTAFDPNLSYFFFYQTSTLANTNRVDTIDWWGKYQLGDVGIKAGRILPQYSRQFYTDIGKYLFMDLQLPEYAFSLQRTPGTEVMWKSGPWTLSLTAGNSVRALDSDTQQNSGLKLAGIGRVVYDVLEPYTYVQETIPDHVEKPQLSIGAAFGFNPVDADSGLQNTRAGMDTYNGTVDFGYRYQHFNTEAAAFWRKDHSPKSTGLNDSDNYGWYWQAGYYLLPKRLELAGTASQVNFEQQQGSSYKNQTVGAVGLNYYFYEHNFKVQADYSHIAGEDWNDNSLEDNKIRVQGQVYF